MTGLSDFTKFIACDNFEAEPTRGFAFPCSACVHRHKTDSEEPCRTCDYNCNSVPDGDGGGA